jgi:hypothetical protein
MSEGGGGDNLAVGWIPPGGVDIEVIPGTSLVSYINADNSKINITQQPAAVTGVDGKTAAFSIAVTGSSDFGPTVFYQWQKNGVNIPGATKPTYITPRLAMADNGAKFKCVVLVPGLQVASEEVILTVVPDTTPPVVLGAGAVKSGANYDVGIQFDEELDAASAQTAANYTLSAGAITAVKLYPNSPGVVLTVSGLTQGNKSTVTVNNVADIKGNKITSASKEFNTTKMGWGVVGAGELGLGAGVVAVADNGFDVYSDGIAEWATYDEASFVYEEITGDFDKKVRVEYQDSSSQWARAGLIARDVTNFGVDRATQEGGAAGRYQKCHVNPVVTAMGTGGNNSWETNRRLETGVATTAAGGGGTPQYPNAWCRLQRIGQTFNMYRSDDGLNWLNLGSTTFDPPMPDKLFVGPEFAPENGNIPEDSGLRAMWLAKFRDYSNTYAAVTPVAKRDYSIGLNFGADEYPNSPGAAALAPTTVAGVPGVKQARWNNLSGASGSAQNMVADAAGAAESTTVTVVFASNNTWSTTGRGEENNKFTSAPDSTLMIGYLDSGAATTTTVTINNLPSKLTTGGYDVYVYFLGGYGNKGGGYRILDATTGSVLKGYIYAKCAVNPTDYLRVPDNTTTNNYGVGNYMVFTGLKAANIIVEATTAGGLGVTTPGQGDPRAPINAIQLVAPTIAPPVTPPALGLVRTPTGITLTFEGTLQSADAITGPWTDVAGSSPLTVAPTAAVKFYRAKR